MTKTHGMGDQLFIGGYDVGADTNALGRIGGGNAPITMTDITQSGMARTGGERDGGMDVTSYFNPSAGGAHEIYSGLPRTDTMMTYTIKQTIGNPSANMLAKQVGYDGNRAQSGEYLLTVNGLSNGYGLVWAFQATAGKRTDASATAAGSVSALDQLTVSPGAFGGVMFYQLFSLGSGTPTIKLQDSTDNITYNDVTGATTGALAAAPAFGMIVLGSIAVNRYIKVVTTGTFTNAVFHVSFYRHRTATAY